MEDFTKTLAGEWEEAERLAACSGDRTLTLSLVEQPKPTELATLKAERGRLREALEKSKATMNIMANKAHELGLEGTSDWDKIAGTADLFGCINMVNGALGDQL
jgi:hypothetical protein